MTLNNQFFDEGFEIEKITVRASINFGSQKAIEEAIKICIQELTNVDVHVETKRGVEIHHIDFEKIYKSIVVEHPKSKRTSDGK